MVRVLLYGAAAVLLLLLWVLSPNPCWGIYIRYLCAFVAIYLLSVLFGASYIAKTSGRQYAVVKAIYGRSLCVRILTRTGGPYADVKGTTMMEILMHKFACVIATLEASFSLILMRFSLLQPQYDWEELT